MLRLLTLLITPLAAQAAPPGILLVQDEKHPEASLTWTTGDSPVTVEGKLPYTSSNNTTEIGHNVACFVALGGTRLDTGWGHPRGAILRVGFYKIDPGKPFFDRIAEGTDLVIEFEGVVFNQDVDVRPDSVIQHIKYQQGDVAACGLSRDYENLYNTSGADDTLGGKIVHDDTGRLGVLDGRVEIEAEGETVNLRAVIPYEYLRHVRDPWLLTAPGTFFEPTHFHVELEVLPDQVYEDMLRVQEEERGGSGEDEG